ncbi:MAG: YraN family protein [Planctomycetota bacterium]
MRRPTGAGSLGPRTLWRREMMFSDWSRIAVRSRTLGARGEAAAARYLRRRGLRIVARRQRSRYGEVDIIAVEGRVVVFVEVKTRRAESHGRPADAVDGLRRDRLTRAALAFLKAHRLLEYPSRFDIVEIVWPRNDRRPKIVWRRNAFPAQGHGQFFR